MGLSPTFGARRFPKGERKELWCARRRKPFFRPGLTRRLRRGRWGCRLMGFHQLRCLKVSKGRAESPLVRPLAHTSCRRPGGLTRRLRRGRWGCRLMGFHQLRCPKVSKGRAESPLVRPLAHTLFPPEGLTRRLRRGSRACSPMGRSHFSFGGERKVCKRKPAARQLLRPAPLCVAGFGLR